MDTVKEYSSIKITREGRTETSDPVIVEQSIELLINGMKLSSIVTTPEDHKELAVGYLLTEGVVESMNDILSVKEENGCVDVRVKSFERTDIMFEIRSAGIGVVRGNRDDGIRIPPGQRFSINTILNSLKFLYSETHDITRGAHTACLIDADGNLKYRALDVGRHNAIDKVVGAASLAGDDLSKMFLLSSGRQPAGMVMKAIRVGIPLVVSKAAPISSGIDCALRANLTLACFADKEKVKVFSCPERIIVKADE
ncbi:formate dehydrogenase family accessory protein FdhD [Methanocella sp. CWC-04]|uniref:Protein FdhD n=2 Tax=Methanooceanicella nereidis TaxID=2052831 RepID=A0AAP2RBH5_9EURY|nr:formate dehydrogenase family accessory protein FdhD [Methanocella sp. CWC-04]